MNTEEYDEYREKEILFYLRDIIQDIERVFTHKERIENFEKKYKEANKLNEPEAEDHWNRHEKNKG